MVLKLAIWAFMILSLTLSCKKGKDLDSIEKARAEIRNAEIAFAKLAGEKGLKEAFVTFASDEAVLLRGKNLIKGKKAIAEFFENQTYQNVRLKWRPDVIEVSASGDLGYTYGPYLFQATDEAGITVEDRGVFHTVWRKEPDGKWRYVWD